MKRLHYYGGALLGATATRLVRSSHPCTRHSTLWSPACLSSTSVPSGTVASQINDMFDNFAEARELIRDAMESAGTVYFHDDIEDAAAMTETTLKQWQGILDTVKQSGDEALHTRLVNENDLKMKQLKAELEEAQHAGGE